MSHIGSIITVLREEKKILPLMGSKHPRLLKN